MNGFKFLYLVPLVSSFVLSGCVVRTYQLTRDRIDQNLSTGNRGYLTGQAPAEKPRKETRTTQVVEVELRSPIKFERAKKAAPDAQVVPVFETPMETPMFSEPATTILDKYTVQKNDTLQKISQKYYGTTKKWLKLYEANRDVLKAPDKIRPGQVINIPDFGQGALAEPKENLK